MIFIITATYPYEPGEPFLEGEMAIWRRLYPDRIVVLPRSMAGAARPMPEGIQLDDTLARRMASPLHLFLNLLRALCSGLLWSEIGWLVRRSKLRPATIIGAMKLATLTFIIRHALNSARRRVGDPEVMYSYWFDQAAYAAVLSSGDHASITRCHGFDVYEERLSSNHWSFKRRLASQFDCIFPVSRNGLNYVRERYLSGRVDLLKLSRLGVAIPSCVTVPSALATLRILSLSYCVEVKNIDRIIEAVRLIGGRLPGIKVSWCHIGDGPLRPSLEKRAHAAFAGSTIDWRFLGALENEDVLSILEAEPFDLILNASSSEGVPVSIMEAMARGIPAVAPDVGGIGEIVSGQTGVLLSPHPTPTAIADAIVASLDHLKSPLTRSRAAAFIRENFDKNRNYEAFVQYVVAIAGSRKSIREAAGHTNVP